MEDGEQTSKYSCAGQDYTPRLHLFLCPLLITIHNQTSHTELPAKAKPFAPWKPGDAFSTSHNDIVHDPYHFDQIRLVLYIYK